MIQQFIKNGDGVYEVTALAFFIDGDSDGVSLIQSQLRDKTTDVITENLRTLAREQGKSVHVKTTYNHETRQRLLRPEYEITPQGEIFDIYNDPRIIGK